MKNKKGKLIEAKEFSKKVVYMRCHAIMMKDAHGQVIYTFNTKKKADQFFKEITSPMSQEKSNLTD